MVTESGISGDADRPGARGASRRVPPRSADGAVTAVRRHARRLARVAGAHGAGAGGRLGLDATRVMIALEPNVHRQLQGARGRAARLRSHPRATRRVWIAAGRAGRRSDRPVRNSTALTGRGPGDYTPSRDARQPRPCGAMRVSRCRGTGECPPISDASKRERGEAGFTAHPKTRPAECTGAREDRRSRLRVGSVQLASRRAARMRR